MTSILVVCTGNICRSPIAEGFLRDALVARFGTDAPTVSSAGTWGVEGMAATPEAVTTALERGSDIGAHRARRLSLVRPAEADLVLGMAGEHRAALVDEPGMVDRTFTLKELVRVLESLPSVEPGAGPDSLGQRVAQAARTRQSGFTGNPLDEDVADPLGMPLQSYRAIAWELDEWIARLVDGLYGVVPVSATTEG
ncbi:MAG: low molecular weight phosphatase family protein [Actinomycetota bacterium]|nr:low molecular weight phosphatase family protein [Actinomycetota bacterium]